MTSGIIKIEVSVISRAKAEGDNTYREKEGSFRQLLLLQIRTTPNCRLLIEECCSIHLGQYPSKLKFAKVVPVFKEGDGTVPNNYIPVSLIQF